MLSKLGTLNKYIPFFEGGARMKRILKTATFWFVVVGILGIILNLTGIDDINLFIGFNPILNAFSSSKACRDTINSVPYLWHVLSIITMAGYGFLIDLIRKATKKN